MGINMFDLHGVLANERSASFLLDGENINKENTVFVVNCPLDRKQSDTYKKNGYQFIETGKIIKPLELVRFNYGRLPVGSLVKAVFCMYKEWNLPSPFFHAFFINLRIFLDWSVVFRHIRIENYIYSNRETAYQSAINIMLSKHGGESWSHGFYFLQREP